MVIGENMGITAQKIAELAGVSRGTVDRALHDRSGVNAEVAEKIKQIAKEHGYQANVIGRALSTGKTHTIGVVLFDLAHSFFSEVFTAIENRAREDNYLPLPALSHLDSETEMKSVNRLLDRGVDGLIIISVRKDKKYLNHLTGLEIPVLSFGNRLDSSIPHIWIDEISAGTNAVDYICSKDYNELIYFAPPLAYKHESNIEAQLCRHKGVVTAAESNGLVCRTVTEQGEMSSLVKNGFESRIAILGSTDEYALFCMNECRSADLKPGKDIGIMGFDNLNILKYITPELTTVDFSKEKLAQSAFEMIHDMINGKKVKDRIVNHRIIKGETL